MVQVSSELTAVMKRFLHALERGDEASIRALMTASDGTLIIGSAPQEWYRGKQAADLLVVQAGAMPEFHYDIKRLAAFDDGTVGWAAADVVSTLSGTATALRMTAVFILESGVWKVVHWHTSVPQEDDPDVIPADLTDTIRRLLGSLDMAADVAALRNRLGTSTVTIVFTDLEGSTRHTATLGDERWSEFITRHFRTIERIATGNDGVLVKTLGDGAMLAFGSVRAALRTAVGIREAAAEDLGPPIRIGVNTGEALTQEDDYFGQTVNVAARIAAAASPGEILVSQIVMKLVEQIKEFHFGDPRALEFKGLLGLQTVYPIELSSEAANR